MPLAMAGAGLFWGPDPLPITTNSVQAGIGFNVASGVQCDNLINCATQILLLN